MRIAVVADTHDKYPPGLAGRLRGADEIWHLGDVCRPGLLDEFGEVGCPVSVVRGNCDWEMSWPLELRLVRGGLRLLLVHHPPVRTPPEVDVVLHGHTHAVRDETDPSGVRWLNPGSVSKPRGGRAPSFAWLGIEGTRLEWRIVSL